MTMLSYEWNLISFNVFNINFFYSFFHMIGHTLFFLTCNLLRKEKNYGQNFYPKLEHLRKCVTPIKVSKIIWKIRLIFTSRWTCGVWCLIRTCLRVLNSKKVTLVFIKKSERFNKIIKGSFHFTFLCHKYIYVN